MSPEERLSLKQRVVELQTIAGGGETPAAIILLADRLVGVLDGILSRLHAIEESIDSVTGDNIDTALCRIGDKLDAIAERMP